MTHKLLANIEKLILVGTSAINGTGNTFNNCITGNKAGNVLDGGSGSDVLRGGLGNDTYVIDNTSDRVIEAANAGTDSVRSSITHVLAANIENLTLVGTAAINGTGNALNNTIVGNAANNVIDGVAGNDTVMGGLGNDVIVGGSGKDVMTGGAGNDRFDFKAVAEMSVGAARDVITDFTVTVDDIDLSRIDANGEAWGHNFIFLADAGSTFTGWAGQLRWFKMDLAGTNKDSTIVEGDIDGNKVADFQIQLTGLKNLTASDFML